MRRKRIKEDDLPNDNLAVYQLVSKESGGIMKKAGLDGPAL